MTLLSVLRSPLEAQQMSLVSFLLYKVSIVLLMESN